MSARITRPGLIAPNRPVLPEAEVKKTAASPVRESPLQGASSLPKAQAKTEHPLMARVFAAARNVAVGAALLGMVAGCATTTGVPLEGGRPVGSTYATLAPSGATPQAKHDHYARLVAGMGGFYRPGEVHVLALRGLELGSNRARTSTVASDFRDTFVVLRPGDDGRPIAIEMRGSTYPGQVGQPGATPDVNGDGIQDVGMILEGAFTSRSNDSARLGDSFWIHMGNGSNRIPSVRDTNQDGIYSPEEYAASRAAGRTSGEILIHRPATTPSGRTVVNSIGCLNVQDFERFMNLVGGPSAAPNFTLIDAARHG